LRWPPKADVVHLALLSAVILVGAWLRASLLHKPIQYDEAYTYLYFASRPLPALLADYSAPNNHLFHTLLVALSSRLLGAAPWTLRLPAFLAGVLTIPAAYLLVRRLGSAHQALAAAALVALAPNLIDYSANGRGYTLIVLFALLLAYLATHLTEHPTPRCWLAYSLVLALGMHTIPIFLYTAVGVSLWMMAIHLTDPLPWPERRRRLLWLAYASLLAGLLTLLLYSPVLLVGTGWRSLIANDIVASRSWPVFLADALPRFHRAILAWMTGFPPATNGGLLIGFLISLTFHRRLTRQRYPLMIFLILGFLLVIILQRVIPLPRVWLSLYAFYLIFAASGLIGVVERLPIRKDARWLDLLILLGAVVILITSSIPAKIQIIAHRDSPEEQLAAYLAETLQPTDTLIAVPPVDIQTAYYLALHGVPLDRLYRPAQPRPIQNALVLVRLTTQHNTLLDVLDYYNLRQQLIPQKARLIYEYGPLQLYSLPAQFTP